MDIEKVKQIIELINNSANVVEFDYKDESIHLTLKKVTAHALIDTDARYAVNTRESPVSQSAPENAIIATEHAGHMITSPLVGTAYTASTPESEPFVVIGSKVKKGDTVCIVEAMKVMNEIEADVDGEIVEILVSNAHSVEFDTPLFKIKTN